MPEWPMAGEQRGILRALAAPPIIVVIDIKLAL
jgi:hypothetical protein